MWLALRNLLAVEMRHLLEEMHVVQQDGTVAPIVSELRSLGAGAPVLMVEPSVVNFDMVASPVKKDPDRGSPFSRALSIRGVRTSC